MRRYYEHSPKIPGGVANRRNTAAKARFRRAGVAASKRARARQRNESIPYAPPEQWYASTGDGGSSFRIVAQPPGPGYRHVVTAREIRARLSQLPAQFIHGLEVVQLSRMTRKKQTFPCYGMQWGSSLYLYPLEESLIETFYQPPRPAIVNEIKMYGGRWVHEPPSAWKLVWTTETVKDFYLNNILIHELGHLLDDRNASYAARERYAEWFAIRYGYLPSRTRSARRGKSGQRIVRRHCRS